MTAFHFEARKYALRQAKDGVIVSFVLHPSDVVAELLSAPIGEHYVVALAPYTEEEHRPPSSTGPEHGASIPAVGGSNPPADTNHRASKLSTDAFWMCRRRDFQEWLGVTGEAEADARIKDILVIQSKTQLDQDEGAAIHWRDLLDRFHAATMPKERA